MACFFQLLLSIHPLSNKNHCFGCKSPLFFVSSPHQKLYARHPTISPPISQITAEPLLGNPCDSCYPRKPRPAPEGAPGNPRHRRFLPSFGPWRGRLLLPDLYRHFRIPTNCSLLTANC
jgi:hypothetical protein